MEAFKTDNPAVVSVVPLYQMVPLQEA